MSVAVLLAFSGLAMAADTDPVWKTVKAGDTPARFAQRYSLTTVELIGLNPDLARRPKRLIPGELLNVNPQTDAPSRPAYRWVFTGGDPAGPSLIKQYESGQDSLVLSAITARLIDQIPQLTGIPEEVRERFRGQLEWQSPRIGFVRSTVDTPLVLNGLVFGGYRAKSKVQYWDGIIICLWTDPVTKQPAPDQLAAQYDPVGFTLDGVEYSYQLLAFLGCQNAAVVRRELPPEPVAVPTPPETTYAPPEPPAPLPPPPPVQAPPLVEREARSRDYYTDYVAWLTDENVRLDRGTDRSMNSLFIGQEFTLWRSPAKRLGLRIRNAEALFDMRARSGDHNAGLVLVPFSNRNLRLDLEGGLGYSAIERLYTEVSHPDEFTWTWQEKKLTTDGFGPYVRAQWIFPANVYADLKWRDHGVINNRGGYVTARPAWFYAKLAYDLQHRPATARHLRDRTIPFAADTMTMSEGRLGISFSPRLLAYGSYQRWEYSSGPDLNQASFWFKRSGPGGGFEWYPFHSPAWRFDGNVIRFRVTDRFRYRYGPGWEVSQTNNREWRFKLGVVYSPQPK